MDAPIQGVPCDDGSCRPRHPWAATYYRPHGRPRYGARLFKEWIMTYGPVDMPENTKRRNRSMMVDGTRLIIEDRGFNGHEMHVVRRALAHLRERHGFERIAPGVDSIYCRPEITYEFVDPFTTNPDDPEELRLVLKFAGCGRDGRTSRTWIPWFPADFHSSMGTDFEPVHDSCGR